MAFLGKGAMVFWNDVIAEGEADFNHWHVFEHIPERVGVPGFLRGRRYVAVAAEPKYFNFYETETFATLTSKPYLDRLNNPTPWTRRSLANFRNSNRTLCAVTASFGVGEGAAILTLRFVPKPGSAPDLTRLIEPLCRRPGVVGAHLLHGDRGASQAETREKALRERPDQIADGVILIEAIEAEPLFALRGDVLSDSALIANGAEAPVAGVYRLHYGLSRVELDSSRAA